MRTLLLILCFSTAVTAQVVPWAKSISGTGGQVVRGIAADALGNAYATGWHTGTTNFNNTGNAINFTASGRDIFITKRDIHGNCIWAKSFGSTGADEGASIHASDDGFLYVTGIFLGTVNFNPAQTGFSLTSSGDFDAFALKMDTAGNVLWVRKFGGALIDEGLGVTTDHAHNVYFCGTFASTANFNHIGTSNLTSAGSGDVYICKLNGSGNLIWVKQIGGTLPDLFGDIEVDKTNNLCITGGFRGSVDFDPGQGIALKTANSGFSHDNFIVKWDTAANYMWVATFGSTGAESSKGISINSKNEIINTGHFAGTVDFNPDSVLINNLTATGVVDVYALKLNANGNFMWAKQLGGKENQTAFACAVDDSDYIYISGWFKDTVDFDPGASLLLLISLGSEDGFVWRLDDNGNVVWAFQNGGTGFQSVTCLAAVKNYTHVITGGQFDNIVDFDPGVGVIQLTSAGSSDGFIQYIFGSNTALPVTLLHFNATTDYRNTYLNWATALEINNKGFEILKSTNGEFFKPVEFVSGKINSNNVTNYNIELPYEQNVYYKLKQIDLDGHFSFSKTAFVAGINTEINVFPNPVINELNITKSEEIKSIQVIDLLGNSVMQLNEVNSKINLTHVNSGIYIVLITDKHNKVWMYKITKL